MKNWSVLVAAVILAAGMLGSAYMLRRAIHDLGWCVQTAGSADFEPGEGSKRQSAIGNRLKRRSTNCANGDSSLVRAIRSFGVIRGFPSFSVLSAALRPVRLCGLGGLCGLSAFAKASADQAWFRLHRMVQGQQRKRRPSRCVCGVVRGRKRA